MTDEKSAAEDRWRHVLTAAGFAIDGEPRPVPPVRPSPRCVGCGGLYGEHWQWCESRRCL